MDMPGGSAEGAVQAEIDKIEVYLKTVIETDFPLKVKSFVSYDQLGSGDSGDLTGIFMADGGKVYGFQISKGDRPVLQRLIEGEAE